MKNLKSTLLVLATVSALALVGCRSGDDTAAAPVTGQLTIALTKTYTGSSVSGGVTSNPGGLSCDSSCPAGRYVQVFPAGTTVTLTASAASGSSFNGWSGSTNCGSAATCTVSGSGTIELTAAFVSNALSGGGDVFVATKATTLFPLGELISFDASNPSVVRTRRPITSSGTVTLAADEKIVGIDFRPSDGLLYGISLKADGSGSVFQIGTDGAIVSSSIKPLKVSTTGLNVPVAGDANVALSGTGFGVDFNPVVDAVVAAAGAQKPASLRLDTSSGQNLRVNVDTGATVADTTLGDNGATATGVNAIAYTNNWRNARGTVLYAINATAGKLYVQNTPNVGPSGGTLYEVGSLGVTGAVAEFGAFDIKGSGANADGSQPALLVAKVGTANYLYSINLTTGAASIVSGPVTITGPTNPSSTNPLSDEIVGMSIRSIATTPVRAGDTLGLTGDGRLLAFDRDQVGTDATAIKDRRFGPRVLHTQNAIAFTPKLASGDRLVDIDVRPQDGKLYGLSLLGRLYDINPLNGIAVHVATLNVALSGDHFGIDFDPRTEVLRVLSDNGKNFAVQQNGNVIESTNDLRRGTTAASATGAAYTHSLAAAGNSTLYAIDAVARGGRRALAVVSTNATIQPAGSTPGQLTNVAASSSPDLGVAPEGDYARGFDIDARTGLAYAAFRVNGKVRLYKVNLASGVALGTVSGAAADDADTIDLQGSQDVIGLAIKQPTALVFALMQNNVLYGFNPLSPAVPLLKRPIVTTGASAADIRTLDYRAVDDSLYAVTTSGKVCSATLTDVNAAATGNVTFRCTPTLTASASDTTPPFYTSIASDTGEYASDFYPKRRAGDIETEASLRVVNVNASTPAEHKNLSITVADGSTVRDGNLNGPATGTCAHSGTTTPAVGALAYSSIVSDSAEPNLYAISSATSCIYTLNSGTGALSTFGSGPIGITLSSAQIGFDVAGADDALPLIALPVSTSTRSILRNINLGATVVFNGVAQDKGSAGPAYANGTATLIPNIVTDVVGDDDALGKVRSLTLWLKPNDQ